MTRTTAALFGATGLICLLATGSVMADGAGTIQGQITGEGHGLRGFVQVEPGTARAVSDANGRYALQVDAGAYQVTCAAPGWRSRKTPVRVVPGQSVTVNCALARLAPPQPEPVAQAEDAVGPITLGLGKAGPTKDARPSLDAPSIRTSRGDRAPATKAVRTPAPRGRPAPRHKRPRRAERRRAPIRAAAPKRDYAGADSAGYLAGRAAPEPLARPEATNRETYARIEESSFKTAKDHPLSTFGIDVDTAAYSNVRRILNEDRLPPADAVRIEELINYFGYDYPQPKGDHPFAIHTEISRAPWNPAHRLVHLGLQGYTVDPAELPPANLVFLLDVSGSMNRPDKLPLLKKALLLLVDQMRPQDRVSIVVYAGAAGLVLPPTPGTQRDTIAAALNGLRAGGSTAGGAGIKLAYQVALDSFVKGGNNRVILATDGDFNVGVSSQKGLVNLIERRRDDGVFLTVLGFGRGNYQEAKMEQLANKGNGNAAYIDSLLEAKKVLVTEMGGTLMTIAKDVKIQVEFNPAKVQSYRLVGYENRALAAKDFNDDKKDAGELGAGHTVTVLYEIVPVGTPGAPGVDPLRYQQPILTGAATSDELMTVKLRYKRPDGDRSQLITHPLVDSDVPLGETSVDFRFSAAVAGFGMLLRGSAHKGGASWDQVIALARDAKGADRNGYRAELVKLAEKAQILHQLEHGRARAQVTQIAR